jgi:hypothetical protein
MKEHGSWKRARICGLQVLRVYERTRESFRVAVGVGHDVMHTCMLLNIIVAKNIHATMKRIPPRMTLMLWLWKGKMELWW